VIEAEYRALQEAGKRGINVSSCTLVKACGANFLLLERFDRCYAGGQVQRIGYISAMTALGAQDGEQRDYLEIIDFIRTFGSRPHEDTKELLKRIRHSVEANNTDDHLRNHGFLHEKGGWHLSPAFDINPNPSGSTQRQTSFAGSLTAESTMQALDLYERNNP
jgi:serine/threonine-protein kinase HipA